MLGFLSKENDPGAKVKRKQIFFVSCPGNLTVAQAKNHFFSRAKAFAEKLNINKVYLHFGKVTINYEFKV